MNATDNKKLNNLNGVGDKYNFKCILMDVLIAVISGIIVAIAYYFFQNSNDFAPGGVGGLATMSYALFNGEISWALLMIAFNIPIFILVSIFVNKKLGIYLIIYMLTQSFGVDLFGRLGFKA